jgi:hypothetical protein
MAPVVDIREGSCLRGDGVVQGNLINQGKISPGSDGNPTAILDIDGDLDLSSTSGVAEIDLGGGMARSRDQIRASGHATFGGTLVIHLLEGFTAAEGDTFDIIEFGTTTAARHGQNDFECFTGLDIADSLSLVASIGETAYRLTVSGPSGNQAPIALPDSATTAADVPLLLDLVSNDTDPDGDDLRIFDLDTSNTSGTVTIESDITVRYVPDPGAPGLDSFTYSVTDCVGGASSAVVVIDVAPATTDVMMEPKEPLGPQDRLLFVAPNPFRDMTEVRWVLPKDGEVEIAVYDVRGATVRSLVRGRHAAGSYVTTWHGRDDAGHAVSGGVYFVRYSMGGEDKSQRVVILK